MNYLPLWNTRVLQRFVGAEAEIQSTEEGAHLWGEVGEISVTAGDLNLRFSWLAKRRGGLMGSPQEWDNHTPLTYDASLIYFGGAELSDGRVRFTCRMTGETLTLYPPDGERINPELIDGLDAEIAVRQHEKYRKWIESRAGAAA